MVVATFTRYPDDAVFNVNNFVTIGTTTYVGDGVTSLYSLPSRVSKNAEILAYFGGVLQEPGSYTLANLSGTTYNNIQFIYPPSPSMPVLLKTVTVPGIFLKTISTVNFLISNISYSNTSPVVVNGNSYVVNGVRTAFALPSESTTTNKNEIFVWLDGILQYPDQWQYPSPTLSTRGITFNTPVYTAANLHIRTIEYASNSTSSIYRAASMVDKKPDRGITMETEFGVNVFESQSGNERRRLRSRRFRRMFDLTYTNITGVHKEAIDSFYKNRYGEFETFIFDLSHISMAGNCLVRFDGKLDAEHQASAGTDLVRQIWTVKFKLKEVYD